MSTIKHLLKGFRRPKDTVMITPESSNSTNGRFVIEPLERGYGITVGNTLRRILLASLPGHAIVAIKINNVLHEFSTIKGVVEDVSEIILNLKQVGIKLHTEDTEKVLHVTKTGPGQLTAKDLVVDSDVSIINPDLVLAHLSKDAKISLKVQVELGRGYVSAEDIKDRIDETGVIAIDANFSPVRKVTFDVQNLRIGNKADYNKLTLDLTTNGALKPEDAVGMAAKLAKEVFVKLINFREVDVEDEDVLSDEDKKALESKAERVLNMPVEDLELSVRSLNCLQSSEIQTVGQLITKQEDELMKTKNFGKKSLDEIKEKLEKLNLLLGMPPAEISKFIENL